MLSMYKSTLQDRLKASTNYLLVAVLALSSGAPFLLSGSADAGQLTSRKVTISSSEIHNGTTNINNDVEFAFAYTSSAASTAVQGIKYEFCTQALGACTIPSSMDVQTASTHDSQSGFPNNATTFTKHATTDEGDCDQGTSSYTLCFERTEATAAAGGSLTHVISGIEAPDVYTTVYVRITLYTNNTFVRGANDANIKDYGTVAAAFVKQLTVTGRVQERLNFCVSALDDGGATDTALTALTDVATCAALTNTTVDIGSIDNTAVAISPVDNDPANGFVGNDAHGIAMINTNAAGGTALTFFVDAVENSGANQSAAAGETDFTRAFRVRGTTVDCTNSATDYTDQCFRSTPSGGIAIGAGNEYFGMYVPCVETSQGVTATPMAVDAAFDGADNTTTASADCENTDKVASPVAAWNENATAQTIATSNTILDDVIVKMSFAASANGTTPTGTYTVVSTYIATPTF